MKKKTEDSEERSERNNQMDGVRNVTEKVESMNIRLNMTGETDKEGFTSMDRIQAMKDKTMKKNMLAFNMTLSHMSDRHLINMNTESVVKIGNKKERKVDILALRLFLKQSTKKIQKISDMYEENQSVLKESMKELRNTKKEKNDDINLSMTNTLKVKKAQTIDNLKLNPGGTMNATMTSRK